MNLVCIGQIKLSPILPTLLYVDTEIVQNYGISKIKSAFKYFPQDSDKNIEDIPLLSKFMPSQHYVCFATGVDDEGVAIYKFIIDNELKAYKLPVKEYEAISKNRILKDFGENLIQMSMYESALKEESEVQIALRTKVRNMLNKFLLLSFNKQDSLKRVVATIQKAIEENGYEAVVGKRSFYIDKNLNLKISDCIYNFCEDEAVIAVLGTDCKALTRETTDLAYVFVSSNWVGMQGLCSPYTNSICSDKQMRVYAQDEDFIYKHNALACDTGTDEIIIDFTDSRFSKYTKEFKQLGCKPSNVTSNFQILPKAKNLKLIHYNGKLNIAQDYFVDNVVLCESNVLVGCYCRQLTLLEMPEYKPVFVDVSKTNFIYLSETGEDKEHIYIDKRSLMYLETLIFLDGTGLYAGMLSNSADIERIELRGTAKDYVDIIAKLKQLGITEGALKNLTIQVADKAVFEQIQNSDIGKVVKKVDSLY